MRLTECGSNSAAAINPSGDGLPGSNVSPPACRYELFVLVQDFNIRNGERAADLNNPAMGDKVCVDCWTKKVDPDIGCWHPVANLGEDREVCCDIGKRGNRATVPLPAAWATLKDRLEWRFDCHETTTLIQIHQLKAKHLVKPTFGQILPQSFFDTIAITHPVAPKRINETLMLRHLTGLNHSIIAADDLEVAGTTFEQLGFCLTPRGVHPSRGTANYCIMFSNSNYIELLGLSGKSSDNAEPLLVEKLSAGEGIAAVAFDSDNGGELWNELAAIDVLATKPSVGERDFATAGKPQSIRFEILRLPSEATPGLRTFICRHLDPSLVYHADFQGHDNTAHTIWGVTLIVDDPMAIAQPYEALLGTPTMADGSLSFETGNCVLQFATADWIEKNLWPDYSARPRCPGSFVTVGVRDLRCAEKLASDRGFAIRAVGNKRLLENTERTCGVGLIYADGTN